jgi:hypothetical protein
MKVIKYTKEMVESRKTMEVDEQDKVSAIRNAIKHDPHVHHCRNRGKDLYVCLPFCVALFLVFQNRPYCSLQGTGI